MSLILTLGLVFAGLTPRTEIVTFAVVAAGEFPDLTSLPPEE